MHNKDIKSKRPQTGKNQGKNNNLNKNHQLFNKKRSYHRPTVSLGSIENTRESNQRIISHENEPAIPSITNFKNTINRDLIPSTFLDLKVFTESKQSSELLKWQKDYIPRISSTHNSEKWPLVAQFEASREVSPCEYRLKTSKPNEHYTKSLCKGKNKIEELVLERSKPFLETKYNTFSRINKYSKGKRAVSLANIEDTKGESSFSIPRPTLSPRNAYFTHTIQDIGLVNKTEAPRSGPYLKIQKKVVVRKNFSFEVKENEKGSSSQSKDKMHRPKEEILSHCHTPLINRRLNKYEINEKEARNPSLKSILGNVFINSKENDENNGKSLSKIGKTSFSLKRGIKISDDRDPVGYILSLYKMGAEKSLQRAKVVNQHSITELVHLLFYFC